MLLGFYYPKRYHGGKTMKRTVSFALSAVLALAMLLFIGCKGNETQPKQADVEAVYTKLVESGQLPSMTKVPERDLEEVYGIDKTKLAQWTMYLSENYAVTVGEVSIFEVSDAAYAEELQNILQNRLDRLRKVAKEYTPAETAKLDPVEVHRVGNYVYMVAGSDYNALMKIMQENIG